MQGGPNLEDPPTAVDKLAKILNEETQSPQNGFPPPLDRGSSSQISHHRLSSQFALQTLQIQNAPPLSDMAGDGRPQQQQQEQEQQEDSCCSRIFCCFRRRS